MKMNLPQKFQYNPEKNNLEETKSESDRELNTQFIEGDTFTQIRENIHWKILLNIQVIFDNNYVLYELIENEPNYDLYRAINLTNKDKVIVKIIDKQAIRESLTSNQGQNNSENEYQQFLKKLKIQSSALKKLHKKSSGVFLIRPIQVYENAEYFIKITENYYGETLESLIKKRQHFPVLQALAILKQMIFSLFELHKQGFILTELNTRNIIYKNGVFKISDFSSMRKVSQNFTSTLNLYHSYNYNDIIAPELLVCPQIVDIKSQIWALGVLFYEMIAQGVPFQERANKIIKQARCHSIMVDLKQDSQRKEINKLLSQMMKVDPDERISWKKLINCEILTKKEYFFSPKMLPLVDTRTISLKNKQSSTIPEQVINNDFLRFSTKSLKIIEQSQLIQPLLTKKATSIQELNNTQSFAILEESKKIGTQKLLDVQYEAFVLVKEINLMVLKAKWIKEEIIEKLQEFEMIDSRRRSHVEMMCLLTQRCYQYLRRSKLLKPQNQDARLDNYLEQLKMLQNQINSLQQTYQQKFRYLNSSPYYVTGDIFSSFTKNKNKQKQKRMYLQQQQGLNFNSQQQIRFTQQEYLNKFIAETKPKNKQEQNLLVKLRNYQKVNSISQQHLQIYPNFYQLVTNEVLKFKLY